MILVFIYVNTYLFPPFLINYSQYKHMPKKKRKEKLDLNLNKRKYLNYFFLFIFLHLQILHQSKRSLDYFSWSVLIRVKTFPNNCALLMRFFQCWSKRLIDASQPQPPVSWTCFKSAITNCTVNDKLITEFVDYNCF